jgi:HK97 family phage major capsid protein
MSTATFFSGPELRFDPLPHQQPKAPRYSIARAIRQLASTDRLTGLEAEVDAELALRYQRQHRSRAPGRRVLIPWDARVESRALDTTVASGGVTVVLDPTIVDILRARTFFGLLGGRIIPDVRGGKFGIVRRTGTATVSWVSEGTGPAAQSNQTLGQATFVPSTATAFTDMSIQASVSIPNSDAVVIEDLSRAIGVEVDRVVMNGNGSDQPLGILQDTSTPVFAWGTNGSAPTWAGMCAIRRTVARASGDVGRMGWLMTPNAEYACRTTEKSTGSGRYLWDTDERICGAPAFATMNLPANGTKGTGTNLSSGIYGSWDMAALAIWGPLEILIDPFKFSLGGVIRISAFMDVDVHVLQPGSFCCFTDMVTP